jgi:hypothetical protein
VICLILKKKNELHDWLGINHGGGGVDLGLGPINIPIGHAPGRRRRRV